MEIIGFILVVVLIVAVFMALEHKGYIEFTSFSAGLEREVDTALQVKKDVDLSGTKADLLAIAKKNKVTTVKQSMKKAEIIDELKKVL